MCGVVAIESTANDPQLVARLRAALDAMRHRGPDGQGIRVDGQSGIGMCRLRVRSAHMDDVPFTDTSSENCHALNGEIYRTGTPRGWKALTGGLHECQAVMDAPASSDGMWSQLSLVDGRVEVRRDPWGIKPLWTRDIEQGVMFASTIDALVAAGGKTTVRMEGVAQFLALGQVVDGGSLWSGIKAVTAGSNSASDEGKDGPNNMLDYLYPSVQRDLDEYAESRSFKTLSNVHATVRDLVGDSVAMTLESDREIGLAVSGGLDSSIIAYHVRELGFSSMKTVSIYTPDQQDGVMDLAALPLPGGVPSTWVHHSREVGPQDYLSLLRRSVVALAQPTSLTSVPLYMALSDTAAEAGVTVLIVGEGADEVWGGYRSYLDITPRTTPLGFYTSPRRLKLAETLVGSGPSRSALSALAGSLPRSSGPDAIRKSESRMSLEPLLARTDALTMDNSIEARTPFLHGMSWAIAKGLPWNDLVSDGQTKRILRDAYSSVLPAFRNEVKKPFRAPFATWLQGPLAESTQILLADGSDAFKSVGIDPRSVRQVQLAGVAGDPDAAALTLSLCSLLMWLQEFVI